MMYCPICGTQVPGEKKFCTNCGAHLAVVAEALTRDDAPDESAARLKAQVKYQRKVGKAMAEAMCGLGFLLVALVMFMATPLPVKSSMWVSIGFIVVGFSSLGKALRDYYEARAALSEAELRVGELRPSASRLTPSTAAPAPTTARLASAPGSVVEHTTHHLRND
jgi:hypothetical protein